MIAAITGATGFIGSHLADALLERGFTVRALVRKTSNLRWLEGKNIERVEGSLSDAESLSRLVEGADYVFHLAGLVKAKTEDEYFKANQGATRTLLECCEKHAPSLKRFLYLSSMTAGGPSPSLESPVNEEHPGQPITTYGRSKLAGEKEVRSFSGKIPWTILRPPAVYGPRDTEIYLYFKTVAGGLNGVIGFDDKRLSLIYYKDLVEGIIQAAQSEKAVDQMYYVGDDEFYSWPRIANICADVFGKKHLTLRIPHFLLFTIAGIAQFIAGIAGKAATFNLEKARDFSQRYWTCDSSKARDDFGYKQITTLEDGLRESIEWYKEQGWLK
ncbi:MAG: nucleoside-diphosphate sugar epimerase [Ectothiorhodospiraceae bacterium]|nr:nucleoside-diphosphate sugar epimerase [Ectothiorhodospiraceae bacterium]